MRMLGGCGLAGRCGIAGRGIGRRAVNEAAGDQSPPDVYLQGVGTQQIPSPHDVIDPHGQIVDHHDQLVGEQSIGTADDGVADVAGQIESLHAEHLVLEGNHRIGAVRNRFRHGDAQRMTISAQDAFPRLRRIGRGEASARARIHHEPVALLWRRRRPDIRARAETGIHQRRRGIHKDGGRRIRSFARS